MHMAPAVEEYLIQLLLASRDPAPYGEDLARWVSYGASPRGTIALDRCARGRAWLQGRDYVTRRKMCRRWHTIPCGIASCCRSRRRRKA